MELLQRSHSSLRTERMSGAAQPGRRRTCGQQSSLGRAQWQGLLSGMQMAMPCHQAAEVHHTLPWPFESDRCSLQMMDMTT